MGGEYSRPVAENLMSGMSARGASAVWTAALPGVRPLRAQSGALIREHLATALAAGDGAAGAHCIHELWMRSELGVNIDSELERLWKAAARSIPEWLPIAYEIAAGFKARRKGRCNLYLVLLDYGDRRNGPYGVYVGMSAYAPAARFDQHKAGIRASGSVLKRGLEVLTGPTLHLQRISRPEAARIEAELAGRLSDAGLLVQGGH